MISKELTIELQNIMREEFGVTLSLEDTTLLANFLLTYFQTMLNIEQTGGTNEK